MRGFSGRKHSSSDFKSSFPTFVPWGVQLFLVSLLRGQILTYNCNHFLFGFLVGRCCIVEKLLFRGNAGKSLINIWGEFFLVQQGGGYSFCAYIVAHYHLCNKEGFYIIFEPHLAELNSRSELLSTCMHKKSNLLFKLMDIKYLFN